MGKIKRCLNYLPEKISDRMRYVCGKMPPDVRLVVVVATLLGFSALSIYITVSSIYNIGRREGERIKIERMRQLELHPGITNDSINFDNERTYGREQTEQTTGTRKEN